MHGMFWTDGDFEVKKIFPGVTLQQCEAEHSYLLLRMNAQVLLTEEWSR